MVKQGDCHGIVFERISGISLMQALQQQPWRIRKIAGQLAELHVKINACPVPANLPSQREQIKYSLDHIDVFDPEKKARILHALSALSDGNHLCHGDFHPENVLLSDHGPIIIDWMTGSYGNPATDLPRSILILGTSALPPIFPR
jgi:aminoglycoside phosphotransferase (APT) family kinase protein